MALGEEEQTLRKHDRSGHIAGYLWSFFSGVLIIYFSITFVLLLVRLIIYVHNSVHWVIAMDGAIMQYIAWRLDCGAIPYADVMDMNQPGTYLINIAVLHVFGAGDLGWRNFDYAVLIVILPAIFLLTASFGRWYGALACTLFCAYHFSLGTLEAGQRDFYMTAFLLWATYCLIAITEGKSLFVNSIMFGGFVGAAVTVKPTAIIAFLIAGIFLTRCETVRAKHKVVIILTAISFLTIIGAVYGWVAWRGGLRTLFELSDFILRVFPRIEHRSMLVYMNDWGVNPLILFSGIFLAILLLFGYIQSKAILRARIISSFVIMSFLHILIQGKGWAYHLYPLLAFSSILVSPYIPTLRDLTVPRFCASLLTCCLTVGICSISPMEPTGYIAPAEAASKDLAPILKTGDTVQTFDMGVYSSLMLLKLHHPMATPYLYDAMIFAPADSHSMRVLRYTALHDFEKTEPDFIVLFYKSWPKDKALHRFDRFPELRDWMTSNYLVWVKRRKYIICINEHRLKSEARTSIPYVHLQNADFETTPL